MENVWIKQENTNELNKAEMKTEGGIKRKQLRTNKTEHTKNEHSS